MSIARLARGWRRLSGVAEADLVPQARLSGPMPWVIAIMVALTAIAVAAGLALRNAANSAEAELEGGITVQIVEASPLRRAEQVQASIAVLRALPDAQWVRLVPQEELDALIEPWLGGAVDAGEGMAVPVPALIDVRLGHPISEERLAAIRRDVTEAAPAARVDAQSTWLRPVFEAIESLQWLAFALVALLAAALAAAVLLAARTALGANRETIEIVHLLGGTDAQIARVFQRSIGIGAAGGGLVGMALALVVVAFFGGRFAELGTGLVESGAFAWNDWMVVALVPVAAVLLAVLTVRVTVMDALRKML